MFQTPLILEATTPDHWALAAPLVWKDASGTILVPKGFITDLASIPRVLRGLPPLDVDGLSRRPGVLHDWAYAARREQGKDAADLLLRDGLIAEGASEVEAEAYYRAVWMFGGEPWADDAKGPEFLTAEDLAAWQASLLLGSA